LLANLPVTAHAFEHVELMQLSIPFTDISLSLGHWVQDGLLTFFFFKVGLDLKMEISGGSLSNVKVAAVPILCAVGGMIMPALIYSLVIFAYAYFQSAGLPDFIVYTSGSGVLPVHEALQGWAVPIATDIAFSLAVLSIFAKNLPFTIRIFLLTLATVDDLLGIIVIAVFFTSIQSLLWILGVMIFALLWWFAVRAVKVQPIFLWISAIGAWYCMYELGVHPTLSGVLLGLLTPAHVIHGEYHVRAKQYEQIVAPYSAILVLPLFALFATGVHLPSLHLSVLWSPVIMAIILALVLGKPMGIVFTAWLSTKFTPLSMPKGLRVRDIVPTSVACGIGFTVSFLIASLAFTSRVVSDESRIGVLVGSIISAILAGILLSRQNKYIK
ncbi:MAG: Na+/H+ antiporter NhaA, partial [Bifidobacteriaceae bacterium]|nr:Na+/H+ antiporter NhaA [Bifidobacteriaceae bacterium]